MIGLTVAQFDKGSVFLGFDILNDDTIFVTLDFMTVEVVMCVESGIPSVSVI
jgi:hypothetical protein